MLLAGRFIAKYSLLSSQKDEQYKLLWDELIFILQIGSQSPNHRKLLSFVRNEISTEAHKMKRSISQITNSPMSPPRSSSEDAQLLLPSNRYDEKLHISIWNKTFCFSFQVIVGYTNCCRFSNKQEAD